MYSQNDEERYILDYFKGQPPGTFLDLGSFDGVRLSNVRALAERGWAGVMVEASPTVFERLRDNYRGFDRVFLYNVAVGTQSGRMLFHDNHNAVGTLYKSQTERWKGEQEFEPIEVLCVEVNSFIESCGCSTFDFISCDIEGEDLNVVTRLDLGALGTKMICVEWNGKDFSAFDRHLTSFGLRLLHKNNENLIYCK